MSPDEKARRVVESVREEEPELTEEQENELEERARRSGSAVQPIRDVPDRFVFRFEVGPAILAQLLEKLEDIPRVPLLDATDAKYPGFYQLFYDGQPKYIGKTARAIGARLREHVGKLYGRRGIDLTKMECRFAFVEDPSLVDVAEGALISFFTEHGLAEWNASGFGSKVSGHGRGGQRASKWSLEFPPDLSLPITAGSDVPISVAALAKQIIGDAPITLSIPTKFRPAFNAEHDQLRRVPAAEMPFERWVEALEQMLSPGWRVDRQAESWYITKS